MVGKKLLFCALLYANLYRFNLAWLLIHDSAFHMFLVHYVACLLMTFAAGLKVFGKQYKVLNFLLGPCGRSFWEKKFVLCVLWSGFKRDQVEFVMNAF